MLFDRVPYLQNLLYQHGSCMGSAPEFVSNNNWMRVLNILMPDVYASIINDSDQSKLIKKMENNPVMAAYGIYETWKLSKVKFADIKTCEIDMYLPSNLTDQFKRATNSLDKARIARELVGQLLVAHGTGLQIAAESLGYSQYESILENDITNLGGVTLMNYFSLFAKAIYLINMYDNIQSPSSRNINNILRESVEISFNKCRKIFKDYTGRPISIILDIKSSAVTPEMLKYMIPVMNNIGIHVTHLGSFKFDQIRDVNVGQRVDNISYGPPIPVKFFHSAGNVQNACLTNKIELNDTVSFNIGSLITYDRYARGEAKKRSYTILSSTIEQLKGFKDFYNLHIFGYIQEFDIDERAATMLINLVNARPDIFDSGFAWGNVNNKKIAGEIDPALFDATTGMSTQILVGSFWDNNLPFYSRTAVSQDSIVHRVNSTVAPVTSVDLDQIQVNRNKLKITLQLNSSCNSTYNFELLIPGWVRDTSVFSNTLSLNNTVTLVWTNIENDNYFVQITKNRFCGISGTVMYNTER